MVPAVRTARMLRVLRATRGWTHLADIRYEAHDTQYLASLLVDAGIARPDIGVTGLSYGGGQSWLLAVLADQVMDTSGGVSKWRSPNGRPMKIAAAVPRYTWTDLIDALQPNGHSSDGVALANGDRTSPFWHREEVVRRLPVRIRPEQRQVRASRRRSDRRPDDLTTWYAQISSGETPLQGTSSTSSPVISRPTTRTA